AFFLTMRHSSLVSAPEDLHHLPWRPIRVGLQDSRRHPGGDFDTSWTNWGNEPLVLTLPGVRAREIEPWSEVGENWCRLEVAFPVWPSSSTPVFLVRSKSKTPFVLLITAHLG